MQVIQEGRGALATFVSTRKAPETASSADVHEMLSDLRMYTTPPSDNITLEDFERLALARLSGMPPRWRTGAASSQWFVLGTLTEPVKTAASPPYANTPVFSLPLEQSHAQC